MAEIIFWSAVILIVYTYAFYPIILMVVRFFYKRPVDKKDITPSVSMIIAAYNEDKNIRRKIENTLELDYPKDRIEIIVASDCSTDNTDNIVREYEDRGVKLARLRDRRGKTAVQNHAVSMAIGEILVFSDAPTIYREDTLKKLVRNYNDKNVGCVTGEVIYINETDAVIGDGGAMYWKYESWIKQMESDIDSVLGAAGCIYSMRRKLYTPFDEEYLSDLVSPLKLIINNKKRKCLDGDLLTPMNVYLKGVRAVMDQEAISIEKTSKTAYEEFKMRSRVVTRAISGILHMSAILDPFKYPLYSYELISHKILRWLVPVFLIVVFISNLFLLDSRLYYVLFQIQSAFYVLALLGFLIDNKNLSKVKMLLIPYYFCTVNLAVLTGTVKYVLGKRDRLWTPMR